MKNYLVRRIGTPAYDPRGVILAIGSTRSRGMHWLRAFHHPGNATAISMNRRPGFTDDSRPGSGSSRELITRLAGLAGGGAAQRVGEYRVHHLAEGLPGVNGDRAECARAGLNFRQPAA